MISNPTQVEVQTFPLTRFVAVSLLAAFLCFFRLGSRAMWQDEGETAVLATSVLHHGIPVAKVGENLVLQDATAFDSAYRWTFHPWGQFYLAAASFALLGQSDLTARLPFAICGVATVSLLFWFAWRWWKSASLATIAAGLLAVSATFIVHARQCRYYAPDAMACLWVTAAWVGLVKRPTRLGAISLALGIACQFYVNFGTLLGLMPGLIILAFLLRPSRRAVAHIGSACVVGAILCLPGAILHRQRFFADGASGAIPWTTKIVTHLSYIDGWFVPVIVLLIGGGALFASAVRRRSSLSDQQRLTFGIALAVLVAAVMIAFPAPIPHIRYLIALMPLAKLVLAVAVMGFFRVAMRVSKPIAIGSTALFVIVLAGTNLASVPIQLIANLRDQRTPDFCTRSSPYIRFDLAGLFYELSQEFESPDVARRSAAGLARPGEIVLVNYGDLPLIFHRPDLIVRGGVSNRGLPIGDHGKPDLILLQANQPIWFREELKSLVQSGEYDSKEELVPNAIYGNIPEPRAHWFSTPTDRARFLIFLKKGHSPGIGDLAIE